MSATVYTGCEGDLIIGGVSFLATKWSFTDELSTEDVSSKGSGGFAYARGCKRKGSGTAEGYFDSAVHQSNPSKIKASKTGAFELELADGGASISGNLLVKKCTIESERDGFAKWNIDFETQGEYYLPGEATS